MSSAKTIRRSISKTIAAPAEKVFDHWLIPTFVGNWMFGPNVQDEKIVELSNEVRPRGEFSYTVSRGSKIIVYSGEFRKIDRPRCLEFSWQEGNSSKTGADFADVAEVSEVAEVADSAELAEVMTEVQVLFVVDADRTRLKVSLRIDPALTGQADHIRDLWSRRCKALAALLSK